MAVRKDPIARFWSKVRKTRGCWLWTGSCWRSGYGRMFINNLDRREIGAHVFSYELHHERPAKLLVCHTCDVKNCVRPDHLFEGTHQDNLADMAAKGRSTRGERSALAKLTKQQAIFAKRSTVPAKVLAKRYGVTEGTIYNVRSGLSWGWL